MQKTIKFLKRLIGSCLFGIILTTAVTGAYNGVIPDDVSCFTEEAPPSYAGATAAGAAAVATDADGVSVYTAQYRLFGVLPLKSVTVSVSARPSVYVGGMPFGVRFSTDGVLVVGYGNEVKNSENPAYRAGLKPGDVIKSVNGKKVSDSGKLSEAINTGHGSTVSVTFERSGGEYTVDLLPYYSQNDEKYKSGINVRDSGAGIGTVTYILPDTLSFGGLGHGICDGESGALIPISRGCVTDVTITGVVKGKPGAPGELRGNFGDGKIGSVIANTGLGIFGVFSEKPEAAGGLTEIASKNEIKEGDATILCTVSGSSPSAYKVRISDIDRSADGNKCFTVKVTDERLLNVTGGIVQGMSGSPIIQNGRLVGAVTHVLVNDPSSGYGIFIENMMNAMPDTII